MLLSGSYHTALESGNNLDSFPSFSTMSFAPYHHAVVEVTAKSASHMKSEFVFQGHVLMVRIFVLHLIVDEACLRLAGEKHLTSQSF